MTASGAHVLPVRPGDASGWRAELALGFVARAGRTVLARRVHNGPLVVQRPHYPEARGVCHTCLIHPPGGIVGGDRLDLDVEIGPEAHALLTTPGATRWYFSRGREACLAQRARIADGATLEWLPQETLVYDGAHARMTTRVELDAGSRFIGWEVLGLGRPACGEAFVSGSLDFRFEIHRDGVPVLLERLRSVAGTVPGMAGHTACGTLVAVGADAALLDATRELLAEPPEGTLAAATLIGDLLVCRGLARHCAPLCALFRRVWSGTRPVLLGAPASEPRIWRT